MYLYSQESPKRNLVIEITFIWKNSCPGGGWRWVSVTVFYVRTIKCLFQKTHRSKTPQWILLMANTKKVGFGQRKTYTLASADLWKWEIIRDLNRSSDSFNILFKIWFTSCSLWHLAVLVQLKIWSRNGEPFIFTSSYRLGNIWLMPVSRFLSSTHVTLAGV